MLQAYADAHYSTLKSSRQSDGSHSADSAANNTTEEPQCSNSGSVSNEAQPTPAVTTEGVTVAASVPPTAGTEQVPVVTADQDTGGAEATSGLQQPEQTTAVTQGADAVSSDRLSHPSSMQPDEGTQIPSRGSTAVLQPAPNIEPPLAALQSPANAAAAAGVAPAVKSTNWRKRMYTEFCNCGSNHESEQQCLPMSKIARRQATD